MEEELITAEELAGYLKVNTRTIYRLLDKKEIPCIKVGRQWRFSKSSIDTWIGNRLSHSKLKILVIDDDQDVCDLFKDVLDGTGHTVYAHTEALKGLDVIRDIDIDLVFLDLKIPLINGAELFRMIRQIKPDLPVTVVTGYPDGKLMHQALTHGPFAVISKPLRSEDIISAVNRYSRLEK